jgi:TolA-binding protein
MRGRAKPGGAGDSCPFDSGRAEQEQRKQQRREQQQQAQHELSQTQEQQQQLRQQQQLERQQQQQKQQQRDRGQKQQLQAGDDEQLSTEPSRLAAQREDRVHAQATGLRPPMSTDRRPSTFPLAFASGLEIRLPEDADLAYVHLERRVFAPGFGVGEPKSKHGAGGSTTPGGAPSASVGGR